MDLTGRQTDEALSTLAEIDRDAAEKIHRALLVALSDQAASLLDEGGPTVSEGLTVRQIDESLAALEAEERQERNRQAWRVQLPVLLQIARTAKVVALQNDKLQEENRTLEGRRVELEQSVRLLLDQVHALEDDLREAQQAGKLKSLIEERERHLAELDAKVGETTALHARLQLALDDLRVRLGMER
jgi:hypothetical protein